MIAENPEHKFRDPSLQKFQAAKKQEQKKKEQSNADDGCDSMSDVHEELNHLNEIMIPKVTGLVYETSNPNMKEVCQELLSELMRRRDERETKLEMIASPDTNPKDLCSSCSCMFSSIPATQVAQPL